MAIQIGQLVQYIDENGKIYAGQIVDRKSYFHPDSKSKHDHEWHLDILYFDSSMKDCVKISDAFKLARSVKSYWSLSYASRDQDEHCYKIINERVDL